jgi:hypothetical protein
MLIAFRPRSVRTSVISHYPLPRHTAASNILMPEAGIPILWRGIGSPTALRKPLSHSHGLVMS